MPYFIYKIFDQADEKNLEFVEQHDAFVPAKTRARSMRAELGAHAEYAVKIIFAASLEEAEMRLMEKREPPVLKEWEK